VATPPPAPRSLRRIAKLALTSLSALFSLTFVGYFCANIVRLSGDPPTLTFTDYLIGLILLTPAFVLYVLAELVGGKSLTNIFERHS
jgi:hypothetical protein